VSGDDLPQQRRGQNADRRFLRQLLSDDPDFLVQRMLHQNEQPQEHGRKDDQQHLIMAHGPGAGNEGDHRIPGHVPQHRDRQSQTEHGTGRGP